MRRGQGSSLRSQIAPLTNTAVNECSIMGKAARRGWCACLALGSFNVGSVRGFMLREPLKQGEGWRRARQGYCAGNPPGIMCKSLDLTYRTTSDFAVRLTVDMIGEADSLLSRMGSTGCAGASYNPLLARRASSRTPFGSRP